MPAFKNILLPVDFSSNTELAVNKAIDFADAGGADVHLLHVVRSKRHWNEPHVNEISQLEQLSKLLHFTSQNVRVDAQIVSSHSFENAIVEKANDIHPDLIIIAKNSNRKFFPIKKKIFPGHLAKKSRCAVLTAKPGSLDNKIKSIVIPVRSNIPKRKLELLVPLAWKKNITVYLVSMLNKLNGFADYDASLSHTLIETFRLLKGEVNCQVFHEIISGQNIARTALRFAKLVDADILLTNPEEIKISDFSGLDISDMLMRDSKLQVLTIEAENTLKIM
ncbi:MAG TPA: universal stress protein [Puia sp.]|nr:universal stress protein [Puia sp.]